jgi:hypothetical protein
MSKTPAPFIRFPRVALAAALAASLAAASVADAKTLRWAGRGDPQTMDPYSQNENLTNNINNLIYDTLVMRDKDLKVIPGLATSWEQLNPTTWRFKLRQGVKFHDGSPFTADDVVFSMQRSAEDTSQIRAYSNAAGKARKIDDYTVEFVTNGPNPIELEHLVTIFMMSKSWCEKNKAVKPLDFKSKEEMITARNANGTGAYSLKSREPDVKTHIVKNADWWGWKGGQEVRRQHRRIVYTPIANDATRLAALVAGNVDVINDPAPQDVPRLQQTPGVKVIEGVEQRIVFIGMDQERNELLCSSVRARRSGTARSRGAVQGDRHRRDPDGDDARPVEALGAMTRRRCRRRPSSRRSASDPAQRRRSCSPTRATRTGSGAARLPEQPLRQRREDPPGARRDVDQDRREHPRLVTMPRAAVFQLEKLDTSLSCWAGAARRPTRSSRCSRCCRRSSNSARRRLNPAATPTQSSTRSSARSRST